MALRQVCVTYLFREGANGREVLLGRKKHGLGAGKLVGLGGKLHPGEHPRTAAVREIEEESGLFVEPSNLEHVGLLTYLFPSKIEWSQESWVYLSETWVGEPEESEELVPEWVSFEHPPLDEMWSDARYWLPAALRGTFVRKSFIFGPDLNTAIASDDPDVDLPAVPPPGTFD